MRTRARWRLPAAGMGAYLIALGALLPASLADTALRAASAGRVRIAEAQGTLWSGTGQLEIRASGGHGAIGRPIAWRFLPGALLRARIACAVELGAGAPPFTAALSWSRIELARVSITLPAASMGLGAPALATLALSGQVRIDIPALSIGLGRANGSAALRWQGAGSALSPVSPLGDYEFRVSADGAAMHAILVTLQGPLTLEGQGSWPVGARPAFLATARMPAELHPQLAPFLRLIAVERADRSFELPAR